MQLDSACGWNMGHMDWEGYGVQMEAADKCCKMMGHEKFMDVAERERSILVIESSHSN